MHWEDPEESGGEGGERGGSGWGTHVTPWAWHLIHAFALHLLHCVSRMTGYRRAWVPVGQGGCGYLISVFSSLAPRAVRWWRETQRCNAGAAPCISRRGAAVETLPSRWEPINGGQAELGNRSRRGGWPSRLRSRYPETVSFPLKTTRSPQVRCRFPPARETAAERKGKSALAVENKGGGGHFEIGVDKEGRDRPNHKLRCYSRSLAARRLG